MSKKKLIIPVVIIALIFLCVPFIILGAGTAIAASSNNDQGIFSDVVEQIENVTISEEQEARVIQDYVANQVESLLLSEGKAGDELTKNQPKSGQFSLKVNLDMEDEGYLITGTADGKYAEIDGEEVTSTAIKYTWEGDGISIDGDAELVTAGNDIHINLTNIPSIPGAESLLGEVSEFEDKWFVITEKDLTELQSSNTYVPNAKQSQIKKEDVEAISEIIKSDLINSRISRLPDETFNGVRANCYKLELDVDDIEKLNDEAKDKLSNYNSDLEDSVKFFQLEACTGRKDNQIYRLYIETEFASTDDSRAVMTIDGTFWDYGAEIDIEIPADSENLVEYFQDYTKKRYDELYGGYPGYQNPYLGTDGDYYK